MLSEPVLSPGTSETAASDASRTGPARARRLTVVVPTFNEAENIARLVGALLSVKTPGVRLSVLIVDDASPDGTGAIADELAARHAHRVSVLHRPRREGLVREVLRLVPDDEVASTGLMRLQQCLDLAHDQPDALTAAADEEDFAPAAAGLAPSTLPEIPRGPAFQWGFDARRKPEVRPQ